MAKKTDNSSFHTVLAFVKDKALAICCAVIVIASVIGGTWIKTGINSMAKSMRADVAKLEAEIGDKRIEIALQLIEFEDKFGEIKIELPVKHYKNLGNERCVIENHSENFSDETMASKADVFLSAFRYLEQHNPNMADMINRRGFKLVIREGASAIVGGWVNPNIPDTIFINAEADNTCSTKQAASVLLHELIHLIQFANGYKDITEGMRPDIRATLDNFSELSASFYSDLTNSPTLATAKNAIERQSSFMEQEVSERRRLFSGPRWIDIDGASYTREHITNEMIRDAKRKTPLMPKKSDRADIMAVMRLIADSKDPDLASVSDDTLEIVYDELYKMCAGQSKHAVIAPTQLEKFKELCARWDAEMAEALNARNFSKRLHVH